MGMNVLFVDRDARLRQDLEAFCTRHVESFRLLPAADGAEAIEILARQPIALVITELEKRDMGGLQFLAQLSRKYPQLPVVITTDSDSPRPRRVALLRGATQFIEKPLIFEDMLDCIFEILDSDQCGLSLQSVPLEIFARLIQFENRTCTLHVHEKVSGNKGTLSFVNGRMADARLEDRTGRSAAEEIIGWENAFYYILEAVELETGGSEEEFVDLI